MENYNDFLSALDKMANEPDTPKLKSMLNLLSGMLDTLFLSIKSKELNVNLDDTSNDDLLYSFFGSNDIVENKDKSQVLVDKLTDLISKQSQKSNESGKSVVQTLP